MSGTSEPSTRTELLVFADYNSFELRDADAEDDPAAIDDTVAALLADLIASVVPGTEGGHECHPCDSHHQRDRATEPVDRRTRRAGLKCALW